MDKEKLIELLLDEKIDDATRDDCAMNLSKYTDDVVVSALIKVANNLNDEEMIRASCGESLAEIWILKNHINYEILNSLQEPALSEAMGIIKGDKFKWYLEFKERYNKQ